jgi:hypothetical protein
LVPRSFLQTGGTRRNHRSPEIHCGHAPEVIGPPAPCRLLPLSGIPPAVDAEIAVGNAHRWFERNSGWAPPDTVTLAEWMADGVCRCPDECLVPPNQWCEHDLASWWLILTSLRHEAPATWDPTLMIPHPDRLDLSRPGAGAAIEAHEHAVEKGQPGYIDPGSGLYVMTAPYLWERGCCGRGCRHCPFYAGG